MGEVVIACERLYFSQEKGLGASMRSQSCVVAFSPLIQHLSWPDSNMNQPSLQCLDDED